ncbi:hypothetical protein F5Y13DRAFT_184320 [Hypoxylon sp. FL1857]|nr:hypothetical protein F5Y13DRAFT_184320 [Hypoxylon sp. FL1857]
MAPAAAFTMACVLFVYTRSSMKEAKRNAQYGREQKRNHSHGKRGDAEGE